MKQEKGRKFISLRIKLTVILLFLGIIPTIVVGMYSYKKASAIIINDFTTNTKAIVGEINRGLDLYFGGMETIVEVLVDNGAFNAMEGQKEIFLSLLKDVQASRAEIIEVYFAETDKSFYGTVPVEALPIGYDPTIRPWYEKAMQQKGEVVYVDPYRDASTGQTIISMSRTIENNGKTIGVLSLDIDLGVLSRQLVDIKIGEEGYPFLTDKTGLLIVHPDQSLIGESSVIDLSYWENARQTKDGFEEYVYWDGSVKYVVYDTHEKTGWKVFGSIVSDELDSKVQDIKIANGLITLLAVGGIIIIAGLISYSMTSKINQVQNSLKEAAEGNLNVVVTIQSKDEFESLGHHFNQMVENIKDLLLNVKQSSRLMSGTAQEVDAMAVENNVAINEVVTIIDHVSHGASDTAQDVQVSFEQLNNLSQKIDLIDGLANQMIHHFNESNALGKEGLHIMDTLIDKTNQNIQLSKVGETTVLDMQSETEKISLITKTIEQISEQTNLLALNAAIESARAGEAGRGFSVVADEIRKLAEQSSISTKQIQELIVTISEKVESVVQSMESSKGMAAQQSNVVEHTKEIFNKMIGSIETLVGEMKEIQASVHNTNKYKEEILTKMESVAAISEQSSASAQEVYSTTEEVVASMSVFIDAAKNLKELSVQLERQMDKFNM
jgi:methyl-accepting chemotaxis protein